MKKTVLAAIILSTLPLAACGGGASENLSVTNEAVVDDLNTTESFGDESFANDATLNTGDLNTIGPVDDPALLNGAAPLDNGIANAL